MSGCISHFKEFPTYKVSSTRINRKPWTEIVNGNIGKLISIWLITNGGEYEVEKGLSAFLYHKVHYIRCSGGKGSVIILYTFYHTVELLRNVYISIWLLDWWTIISDLIAIYYIFASFYELSKHCIIFYCFKIKQEISGSNNKK